MATICRHCGKVVDHVAPETGLQYPVCDRCIRERHASSPLNINVWKRRLIAAIVEKRCSEEDLQLIARACLYAAEYGPDLDFGGLDTIVEGAAQC